MVADPNSQSLAQLPTGDRNPFSSWRWRLRYGRHSNARNASYIAASYVKFVESACARVIPLIYNDPTEVVEEKMGLVNGVILTGGKKE
ncbi:gamma-glutamyl hydrolase 2-like isoform X2 [Cucumis melo var. makuwa]|uniref:folate gamma-glutamyl hydrolase n=1 Tax=Cucumis melo var. makuwa TaxID=1194695 RepID=A0A5D3DWU6_CUCMM|nr:gamma-glutamyl hydrolase 2-like isoform X2 [Cucumis melo var. makuwa]TYK27908.1 gamma-glutamyl hydrolase 2-like isoform X2 [Cucumis melo var. makuwa]